MYTHTHTYTTLTTIITVEVTHLKDFFVKEKKTPVNIAMKKTCVCMCVVLTYLAQHIKGGGGEWTVSRLSQLTIVTAWTCSF